MRRSTRSRKSASPERSLVAILAVLGLLGSASIALGEDAEEARRHFEKAELAYKLGRYAEAIASYEAAYKAMPEPAFLFNVAQAHRQQYQIDRKPHHIHKALSLYKAYLRDSPEAKNRQVVLKLVDELKGILSDIEARSQAAPAKATTLVLRSEGALGASVRLDGKPIGTIPLSKEVSPGTHTIEATRDGYAPWSTIVTVAAGSQLEVPVLLQPLGAARGTPTPVYKRWWFWTIIGAVAAGAAGTGIYFGTRGESATPMPQIDLR
jgi:tetratricopeptide (TPR) repeat protein